MDPSLDFYIQTSKEDFIRHFQEFKESINQKVTIINKYRASFLGEIENKYIDDFDFKIINMTF